LRAVSTAWAPPSACSRPLKSGRRTPLSARHDHDRRAGGARADGVERAVLEQTACECYRIVKAEYQRLLGR
jgi:hypothetical protein